MSNKLGNARMPKVFHVGHEKLKPVARAAKDNTARYISD